MSREKSKVVLTKLELEVMRAVWEAGEPIELTVRDVVERLNVGRRKPLAYNTVQTVLNILKEKGVVRARPGGGRAHVYLPRFSREHVTTSMVGELVDRLYDGQVQPLLLNLVEREPLSRDELEKLKRLIDERLVDEQEERGDAGSSAADAEDGR